jgi:hypothetical protein
VGKNRENTMDIMDTISFTVLVGPEKVKYKRRSQSLYRHDQHHTQVWVDPTLWSYPPATVTPHFKGLDQDFTDEWNELHRQFEIYVVGYNGIGPPSKQPYPYPQPPKPRHVLPEAESSRKSEISV